MNNVRKEFIESFSNVLIIWNYFIIIYQSKMMRIKSFVWEKKALQLPKGFVVSNFFCIKVSKKMFLFFSQKFQTIIYLSHMIYFIFFGHIFHVFILQSTLYHNSFTYCFFSYRELDLPLHNDFSKEFSHWCNGELNLLNLQAFILSLLTYVYLTKFIWMHNCQSFRNFYILWFSVSFF